MKTVIHPLLASSMTLFYSCFCVCCSSLAKLLSCSDVDCVVEAILLLMLSLVDSDTFRCRDRAASTLHTIALVGICFGVAERSVRITVASFSFVSGMGKNVPEPVFVQSPSFLFFIAVVSVSAGVQCRQ